MNKSWFIFQGLALTPKEANWLPHGVSPPQSPQIRSPSPRLVFRYISEEKDERSKSMTMSELNSGPREVDQADCEQRKDEHGTAPDIRAISHL